MHVKLVKVLFPDNLVEEKLPFCSWWCACWCAPPAHHTWHWSVAAAPQGSHHSWNSTCHTSAPACHHYVPTPLGSGQGQTNGEMFNRYTTACKKNCLGKTKRKGYGYTSPLFTAVHSVKSGWRVDSSTATLHVLFINSWSQTQTVTHVLYTCYVGLQHWLEIRYKEENRTSQS